MVMYSVLPFTLIAVFNFVIVSTIYLKNKNMSTIRNQSDNVRRSKKQNKITRTIVIITFLYIVFSLPTASIQGEVYALLDSTIIGRFFITLFNFLSFFYQASNFFLLFLTNKQFSKEVRNIFRIQ